MCRAMPRLPVPARLASERSSAPQGRITDRSERNQEDAAAELFQHLRSDLESEPRLARATRTGERQHADVALPKKTYDFSNLVVSTDQWIRLDGQIRWSVPERLQRRELSRQPFDHELEEMLRLEQIFEPVLA